MAKRVAGATVRNRALPRERLAWDGKKLVQDDAEAADENDDKQRTALVNHARNTRLSDMIALAKSEPVLPVKPEELDPDPWLLNCENRVIDLRTGEVLRHQRQNLITKATPIEFDPEAQCPSGTHFLTAPCPEQGLHRLPSCPSVA